MPPETRRARAAWFALVTLAFGTSYALLPLYSSNQNHHFLIGIARAGDGFLRNDWLAATRDPFPVFTAWVWLVHRYAFDALHYVVYYLLLGAYAYGLIGLAERAIPGGSTRARLMLLAVLCVLHNEVIGYAIGFRLERMPWWQMTHWGVAEQEIFGHSAFQASSFGLLLPLALRWFMERRAILAAALVGIVVLVHFSYSLTGAALVCGFMVVEWRRSGAGRAAAVAAAALACAVPAAVYVATTFAPTSPQASERAAAILANHLPQETNPAVWLGVKAWMQVGWMVVGLVLAAGTNLFVPLLCVFVAGASLTAVQLLTHNLELSLLFPWRGSVLLVPVATALAVRALLVRVRVERRRLAMPLAAGLLAVSIVLSAGRMVLNFAYYDGVQALTSRLDRIVPSGLRDDFARALRPETLPMMDAVRASLRPSDLYLVPPDLQRFRLRAGAPVLADSKSHPYVDVEVLEWNDRLTLVRQFYANPNCAVLDRIRNRYSITHVVMEGRALQCPGWQRAYADEVFNIYRVTAP